MKFLKPMYIILIGASIVVLGSFVVAVGTFLQNKASSEKSAIQLSKIEELTDKNAALALQLANAVMEINANITGGDAFCNIEVYNSAPGIFFLSAINKFEYNLPKTILKIFDYSEMENCSFKNIHEKNCINKTCSEENSIEMPERDFKSNTNYSIAGGEFLKISSEDRKLGIMILTPRNQFFVQVIYKINSPKDINFDTRILKKVNGEYIVIGGNQDPNNSAYEDKFNKLFTLPPEIPVYDE